MPFPAFYLRSALSVHCSTSRPDQSTHRSLPYTVDHRRSVLKLKMAAPDSDLTSTFNSPCAACKFLRRKCQPECVFAPYFPPDQPNKFAHVHKVFGASNVTKLLSDLNPCQREDAVNSLAYEAEMRLRDPVYGCVGVIYALQHELQQINIDLQRKKIDLIRARLELVKYRPSSSVAATATLPIGGNFPASADQMRIGGEGLRNVFEIEEFVTPTHAPAECSSSYYATELASHVGLDTVGGGSRYHSDDLSAINYMPYSQKQRQENQFYNPRIFDGDND